MKVNLIFPNQLFEDLSLISNKNKTFLVEDGEFFTAFNFHKNKLVLHRAAMKFYESYLLKNGFDVEYVDFKKDWLKILKQNNIDEIITYELNNLELEEKIKKAKFKVAYLKSPMFLSSNEEFKDFFASKTHFSQTSFYIYMRKQHKILLDKNLKPEGGKWTFDKENRQKIPQNIKIPKIPKIDENIYVKEAKKYVGTHEFFNYPSTFDEVDFWVEDFVQNRLENFGVYQDAIVENDSHLFHSNISFALNTGLITPQTLLEKIISANVPINSKEGYIRQIIGWREFVKGIYGLIGQEQMKSNFGALKTS